MILSLFLRFVASVELRTYEERTGISESDASTSFGKSFCACKSQEIIVFVGDPDYEGDGDTTGAVFYYRWSMTEHEFQRVGIIEANDMRQAWTMSEFGRSVAGTADCGKLIIGMRFSFVSAYHTDYATYSGSEGNRDEDESFGQKVMYDQTMDTRVIASATSAHYFPETSLMSESETAMTCDDSNLLDVVTVQGWVMGICEGESVIKVYNMNTTQEIQVAAPKNAVIGAAADESIVVAVGESESMLFYNGTWKTIELGVEGAKSVAISSHIIGVQRERDVVFYQYNDDLEVSSSEEWSPCPGKISASGFIGEEHFMASCTEDKSLKEVSVYYSNSIASTATRVVVTLLAVLIWALVVVGGCVFWLCRNEQAQEEPSGDCDGEDVSYSDW